LNVPDAPAFDEPWQAQVFAMAVMLNQRSLFSWSEWTQALGAEIAAGPQEAGNETYFQNWLCALEKILITKGVASAADLANLAEAWRAAALATPHGQPIVLDGSRLRPSELSRARSLKSISRFWREQMCRIYAESR
jgi:nitrile hydratase accessory protein